MKVRVGQHSDRGSKPVNQDFHGVTLPAEPLLGSKGVAVAIADGIGSSDVSQVASEFAVMGILEDYYCTSEAWSVRKSAERVLAATNSWLHSRTAQSEWRYDKDRGYICTLSALVLKGRTAHLFHVGDTRVYRLAGNSLEQLTQDHRVWVAGGQSYLARALGYSLQLEIDYQAIDIDEGDVFVLASDGVYEHASAAFIVEALRSGREDLDEVARAIVGEALARGSDDNATVQIVAVDALPGRQPAELARQLAQLPPPPLLAPRAEIDGWRIVREVHGSSRSHIYLATDAQTGRAAILKAPSVELQGDAEYLERFLLEEWIARRIDSAHVLRPCAQSRPRTSLYIATEYIEGQTLAQWMRDNPRPPLETVRGIVEQIARGLQAFHRLEMLHQDLRPENVMIDSTGTVKIIDFGSARVAGIVEMGRPVDADRVLGTLAYTAPEYFLGEAGSERSDIYSLGVIAYAMLSGRLPYGTEVAKARTRSVAMRLRYQSVLHEEREVPAWVDEVLRKAVHPDARRRYATLSEFTYDLRHPNTAASRGNPPLIERNPVLFWKWVSAVLAVLLLATLLGRLSG